MLSAGKVLVGQSANILFYLGGRENLAPKMNRPGCGRIRSSSPSPIFWSKPTTSITRSAATSITRPEAGTLRRAARFEDPRAQT